MVPKITDCFNEKKRFNWQTTFCRNHKYMYMLNVLGLFYWNVRFSGLNWSLTTPLMLKHGEARPKKAQKK